ncbi:hypothetical protein D6789_04175 [Candidatus Woesearchaeota archaeon]|nr:MAG: hypothetical protein D6789_04175 [Candidatus Woesearchaeota archaeon]
MNKEQRERFQHWQSKTIDQFTQVTNTLLLISSAFLGYLISLRTSNGLYAPVWLMGLLIILTTMMIIILVFLSYNRLQDFRKTQSKIKNKDISKEKLREIGNNSWKLLYWLLILFSIDVIVFVVAVMWK